MAYPSTPHGVKSVQVLGEQPKYVSVHGVLGVALCPAARVLGSGFEGLPQHSPRGEVACGGDRVWDGPRG